MAAAVAVAEGRQPSDIHTVIEVFRLVSLGSLRVKACDEG